MLAKFSPRLLTAAIFILLVACGKVERKAVPAEIDTSTPTSSKPLEVEQQ